MSQVDTELEKGLLAILCTFHKYAQGKMGDLHQAAFHSLLRSELCHLLTVRPCSPHQQPAPPPSQSQSY